MPRQYTITLVLRHPLPLIGTPLSAFDNTHLTLARIIFYLSTVNSYMFIDIGLHLQPHCT